MMNITIAAVVITVWLIGCAPGVTAAAPAPDPPFTADQVVASLNRTLAWYRQARVAMRTLNAATGSVFTRDDEQTALLIVQRAFDTARAEAALLSQHGKGRSDADEQQQRATEEQAEIRRAIEGEQQELQRVQRRMRAAPVREHPVLQRELVASANRLALHEARREMFTKFDPVDHLAPNVGADLEHQIQTLADSVPELRGGAAAAPAVTPGTSGSATTGGLRRLMALQRSRSSLEELEATTSQLARGVDGDLKAIDATLQPIAARLRALSTDPTEGGISLVDGQRTFQELLVRSRLVGAILPPLRDEAALVRRYARDLGAWNRALNQDIGEALESLALSLVGVLIAVVAILVGAAVWRIAAIRYVRDAYRRRLLMIARRVVVVVALALVMIFHFASELTALVAGLGFAAAGIAFALQNVILSVAGYFSMMTPGDGIRIGDRVSLQGPFGYVQGDVMEIGLVRIRLRELAGDPIQPTGRVVVFPNSVVFTGSFFKHPSDEPGGPEMAPRTPQPSPTPGSTRSRLYNVRPS